MIDQVQSDIDSATVELGKVQAAIPNLVTLIKTLQGQLAAITPATPEDTSKLNAAVVSTDALLATLASLAPTPPTAEPEAGANKASE